MVLSVTQSVVAADGGLLGAKVDGLVEQSDRAGWMWLVGGLRWVAGGEGQMGWREWPSIDGRPTRIEELVEVQSREESSEGK